MSRDQRWVLDALICAINGGSIAERLDVYLL